MGDRGQWEMLTDGIPARRGVVVPAAVGDDVSPIELAHAVRHDKLGLGGEGFGVNPLGERVPAVESARGGRCWR